MSTTGLAIVYIIIWWIVFFAILPIDVERKKLIKVEGEDPGSPENPKMLKKFIYCTGITTILFVLIYLLMNLLGGDGLSTTPIVCSKKIPSSLRSLFIDLKKVL